MKTGHSGAGQALMSTVLALTEQLSAASTRADIAAIIAESTVSRLGASAGFVAVVSDDGAALEMLSHVREGQPDVPNCRLELDQRLPVVDAWRFGVPIFIGDRNELYRRFPTMDRGRTDREALASLPLEAEGVRLGAMNFTFATRQAFTPDDQAMLRAVAALCAQGLRRAMLAADLDRVRNDFVVTASHELRTPLAAIYGAAVTLTDAQLELAEADRDELLKMIRGQSERMAAIVDDLRLTALLDAEQVEFEVRPIDPRDVIDEALAYWRGDKRVVLHVEDQAPNALADPLRLQQVIANLVDNAHKYSPSKSPVEVGIRTVGDRVSISVRDHGPGIPLGLRDRVVEKFYRADASHRNGVAGTGLGLYISARLVAGMGGTLTLDDPEFGTGTAAIISIPAAQ